MEDRHDQPANSERLLDSYTRRASKSVSRSGNFLTFYWVYRPVGEGTGKAK
ncbi:hypothetical protein TBK1r_72450 [Stieleria magnilauensis]|uniref:Uncharacterized protein n=1 Tax=Stieleria magnilauensis TaxID=2527963 RepID=A0ABX5Y1R4_9BACT|nr:hypothetical protein TBK1r_72450 [Planctomycetes bacterium TBK1r]